MSKLDYQCKKTRDLRLFDIPNKLLLGAGPSNCSLRALKAMSLPALTPVSWETYQMMDEIQEYLKYVFQTKNQLTFVHQSSGTGGIETALVNLLEPGEKIIVAVAGAWGERTVSKAQRAHLDVVRLTVEDGEVYTFEELEKAIIKHKPVLLCVTHSESSHGTLQPLEGLADICHKHNCLLFVDVVISLATDPLFVDRWGIDIAVAATQKGLGAPAGMSLLTFNPKAQERIWKRKSTVSLYNDIISIADYWNCLGNPRKYCYTYNTNALAGIREALALIAEEGLENVWERHRICTEKLWNGLAKCELTPFVKKIENRTHSLTTIVLPKDIDWVSLYEYMNKEYLVELSFGIGPTVNKAMRLGLMGINAQPEIVDFVLDVIRKSIDYLRKNTFKAQPRSEVL